MGKSSPTFGREEHHVTYWQDAHSCSVGCHDVTLMVKTSVTVTGPKGSLSHDVADPITIAEEDGSLVVQRPNDESSSTSLHGLTPHACQQHGHRRDRGLLPRPSRSWAPATSVTANGSGSGVRSGITATRSRCQGPRRHLVRRREPDPASRWPESTSNRSARQRRTFASCASRSPTRVRAFGTRGEVVRRKAGKAGK